MGLADLFLLIIIPVLPERSFIQPVPALVLNSVYGSEAFYRKATWDRGPKSTDAPVKRNDRGISSLIFGFSVRPVSCSFPLITHNPLPAMALRLPVQALHPPTIPHPRPQLHLPAGSSLL